MPTALTALIALAILSAPDQAGEQPPLADSASAAFEFRNIKAGEMVPDVRAAGLAVCSRSRSDWTCMPTITVAGHLANTMWQFRSGLLQSLEITSSRAAYLAFRDAFTERYGAPCREDVETWQNATGASLQNHIHVWCFSTGKLELREIGNRINRTEAVYLDGPDNAPRPVVDF